MAAATADLLAGVCRICMALPEVTEGRTQVAEILTDAYRQVAPKFLIARLA